ncbi:MAG: GNAT family N-acetyltransferase [Rhodococcus sp. (in: high G+C Gram-positive bacteria)]
MTDYRLVSSVPGLADYRRLRSDAGLTPVTVEQAVPALRNAWAGCHLVHESTGDVVAMGRVIGDGGWYFHIVDMATAPDHQRQGLGDRVLNWLLDTITEAAPDSPYITLMADPPGRRLYEKHGFTTTPSVGLVYRPSSRAG